MTPHPLYAIHGDNDLDYDGYLVLTRAVGRDPNDRSGENFNRLPHTKIVRLNHGYHPNGTIPLPEHYADFAARVAHYVEMSPGCSRWIIGNEPNHEQERPNGQPITPQDYAECYTLCRDAIRAVKFHNGDQVLVAAIAPWNATTPGHEDWIRYFEDVQFELGVGGCDGFAVHAYVREQAPESVTDLSKMGAPYEFYHSGFQVYRDWMHSILPRFQGLPVYITEACVAGEPWADINNGTVLAMYAEVDWWNTLYPDRPISCLALYRWQYDQWELWNKPSVQADFYNAVAQGYTWPQTELPEEGELKNPSLELPYHRDAQNSTVEVAHDWTYFASKGAPPIGGGDPGPCELPEYKALPKSQDPRRVWDGNTSQCWFIRWKVMDAGVYQTVDVTAGATYQLDAMCQAWCSNSNDPTVSDGELYVTLGIDPTGGTDAFSSRVAWSEWEYIGADYKQHTSPKVLADGNRITVFVRAWNKWRLSHNDIYVDDLHLTETGSPPIPPGGDCKYDETRLLERIAEIVHEAVRYELDSTRLGPNE